MHDGDCNNTALVIPGRYHTLGRNATSCIAAVGSDDARTVLNVDRVSIARAFDDVLTLPSPCDDNIIEPFSKLYSKWQLTLLQPKVSSSEFLFVNGGKLGGQTALGNDASTIHVTVEDAPLFPAASTDQKDTTGTEPSREVMFAIAVVASVAVATLTSSPVTL